MAETPRERPNLAEAERAADALTNIYSSPPIPPHEIAEENGVHVLSIDFGRQAETVSGLVDFANARLYANKSDNLERQLFTVAHELGHWLLHKEFYETDPERYNFLPRFSSPDRDDPLEQEANRFAASLLIPRRLLVSVLHAPVSKLSGIFLVNRAMMERRIRDVR